MLNFTLIRNVAVGTDPIYFLINSYGKSQSVVEFIKQLTNSNTIRFHLYTKGNTRQEN